MVKNSLKVNIRNTLGLGLIGLSFLLPTSSNAAGKLEVWNSDPSGSIYENNVLFREGSNAGYTKNAFTPSLEIFYQNGSLSNGTAGVNLSTSKTYLCPLWFNGSTSVQISNSIAFKIVSSWPSNTLCTADILIDGKYTNSIQDVLAFTAANSNSAGYAFVPIPNITNAVNGARYGSVTMRFAPLETIASSAGSQGTISPNGNVLVPYGDSTNFNIAATNSDYQIADIKTNGVSVGGTFGTSSTNYVWNNVTSNGTISASFSPKVTTNGIPYTWLTQYGITNKSDSVETQDGDLDRVTTLDEYFADTNPTNQNSYFQIGPITQNGSQMVLGINPSSTDRVYGIDYKTNLMDSTWNSATNNIVGTGSNLLINLNKDADLKFYRANVGLRQ